MSRKSKKRSDDDGRYFLGLDPAMKSKLAKLASANNRTPRLQVEHLIHIHYDKLVSDRKRKAVAG